MLAPLFLTNCPSPDKSPPAPVAGAVPAPSERQADPPADGATAALPETSTQPATIVLVPVESDLASADDGLTDDIIIPEGLVPSIAPRDTSIGLLPLASDGESELYQIVSDFLTSWLAGTINEESIDVREQTRLTRLLADIDNSEYPPRFFRIGARPAPDATDRFADLTLRLFSEVGSATGAIYLEYTNERWYITDIVISVTQLARQEPLSNFEPEYYGNYGTTY